MARKGETNRAAFIAGFRVDEKQKEKTKYSIMKIVQ